MENYNEQMEKALLEMVKQKETADRRLLTMEIVIGIISTMFLFAMIAVGMIVIIISEKTWIFWLLFGIGAAQFIVCVLFALRIEQEMCIRDRKGAGYGKNE